MIKPLGNKTLIKIEKIKETASGIILSEEQRKLDGVVIETGSKTVKVGDRVVFSPYGPQEVEIDGDTYIVADEEHLMAIIG